MNHNSLIKSHHRKGCTNNLDKQTAFNLIKDYIYTPSNMSLKVVKELEYEREFKSNRKKRRHYLLQGLSFTELDFSNSQSRLYYPQISNKAQDTMHLRLIYMNKLRLSIQIESECQRRYRSVHFINYIPVYDNQGGTVKSNSINSKNRASSKFSNRLSKMRDESRIKKESKYRNDSRYIFDEHFYHDLKIRQESFLRLRNDVLFDDISKVLLTYTNFIIERSDEMYDLDWSGSNIPPLKSNPHLYYAGNYGMVDGITECNRINKAAHKYQNVLINQNEAIEALSHMYGMNHLLDTTDSFNNRKKSIAKFVPQRMGANETFEEITESEYSDQISDI